jgi:hypothetical protein
MRPHILRVLAFPAVAVTLPGLALPGAGTAAAAPAPGPAPASARPVTAYVVAPRHAPVFEPAAASFWSAGSGVALGAAGCAKLPCRAQLVTSGRTWTTSTVGNSEPLNSLAYVTQAASLGRESRW